MTMTPHPDLASKRQVSESALLFLHTQVVDYNLCGPGSRFYDVPSPSTSPSNEILLQLSAKRKRLEGMGQDVGKKLAERHVHYRDRFEQDLDKVKFICKDFWENTFRKQIDVLRTNHRGLYVLTDNNFKWLSSVSSPIAVVIDGKDEDGVDDEKVMKHVLVPDDFVVFPCGIICGALTRLGLRCRVTADLFPTEPGYRVSFNVQLIQS